MPEHPGRHYAGITSADLAELRPGDTAGDIVKKFGHPGGEIPLPWFIYASADDAGKYYIFQFARNGRKDLRPTDQLISVVLTSQEERGPGVIVWPRQKENRSH